ncbi:unnamed protein product [Rotaria sp. Silwood1]|nr:unnamed protein product [Rotaria sp. Silwood1]CAF0993941.1 unnamed protein product [Rotaria sp. Silwood1]
MNSMVATNTDNKIPSTSLPTNNYFIPPFKMNLSGNLLYPIILWTKDDVQKWIAYCIDEYSLRDVNLNDFEMNGKALLLLNEDGFKQRSLRSGDILHKALQQHNALVKSLTCQIFPYQLWSNFGLFPPSSIRHFNIPLPPHPPPPPPPLRPSPMPYMQPTVNYMYHPPEKHQQTDFMNLHQSIRTQQILNSSSSSSTKPFEQNNFHHSMSSIKQECTDRKDNDKVPCQSITSHSTSISQQLNEPKPLKIRSGLFSKTKQQTNDVTNVNDNDISRKIRYYHDRVDFHGNIIMKPQAAKNCRILWEFLYILLEDPYYESIIHWENREKMIFRIVQADKLAALWGLQKNRLSMTYEKLSRGMRYYYSNNIIAKEQSKRLLYRFMRSPDEIRKTMKRNVDTTSTFYSTINKQSSFSSSSSTSNLPRQESSTEISNRYLQLFSVHSPSSTPMISNLSPIDNRLFTTPNDSISKSDRSSSSSPVSFDSNHDNERQYCNLSQSSSAIASTKRKTNLPTSLNTCLSHNYSRDQPLDLVVPKDEENHINYKKQKLIYNSANI